MSRPRPIAPLVGLAVLGAALAACDRVDDAERETCIAVVPAIEAATTAPIEIVSVEPLRGGRRTLHLQYRVGLGASARGGFIDCAFDPEGPGPGASTLVGVRSSAGALSEARMFILVRFWLHDLDARRAGAARLVRASSAP